MAARRALFSKTLQLYSNFITRSYTIWIPNTIPNCPKDFNTISVRLCSSEVLNSSTNHVNHPSHMRVCGANCEQVGISEKRNISVEKLFADIGLPLSKVKKQMDITRLSLERVKEKIEILQGIGLKIDEVSKVLTRRPSVLVIRNEVLHGRIEALRQVGIEPNALVHAVKKSPGILTGRTEETIAPKVG